MQHWKSEVFFFLLLFTHKQPAGLGPMARHLIIIINSNFSTSLVSQKLYSHQTNNSPMIQTKEVFHEFVGLQFGFSHNAVELFHDIFAHHNSPCLLRHNCQVKPVTVKRNLTGAAVVTLANTFGKSSLLEKKKNTFETGHPCNDCLHCTLLKERFFVLLHAPCPKKGGGRAGGLRPTYVGLVNQYSQVSLFTVLCDSVYHKQQNQSTICFC